MIDEGPLHIAQSEQLQSVVNEENVHRTFDMQENNVLEQCLNLSNTQFKYMTEFH